MFKDYVGSDPPSYQVGDRVRVLFLADDLREAVIDRGIWNWMIPSVLFAAAAILAWLFVFIRSRPAPAGRLSRETPLALGASVSDLTNSMIIPA